MHTLRFTAGLVIVLLFVLHALKSSSVHAHHQGGESAGEETVMQKGFYGRKIGRLEVMASKNSGANRSDGKCEIEGKGKKYCKYWSEIYRSSSHPTKVETADYRGPKRHPPKHN